ncbi:MAG: DUF4307 domain-containing protein [Actinomycetia bacterium]|nr:DUF4307 domain-containing protein [Actinomycetes bacterium]
MSQTDPAAHNRRWWIIGTTLITLFTALVIAIGLYFQHDQVRHTVTHYEVVDDQSVVVGFDVHRPADRAVVCRVVAIALDFATVGTTDITIAADEDGGARSVHREVTLRTTTRANTGTVSNCVLEGARSQ